MLLTSIAPEPESGDGPVRDRDTTETSGPGPSPRPGGLLMWPGFLAGVLILGGYVPTVRLAGEDGLEAMLWAVAGATFVVYATLIPAVFRMARADASARLMLGFRAMGVRFIATLLPAGWVAARKMVETTTFLVWVAIAYAVLTIVEAVILVYWNNRLGKQA